MEIKQLNKSDPEVVYGVFKNGEAEFLDGGTPVCVDYTTDADGNTVILPTTAMLHMFAGCVKSGETLGTSGQPNEYGLVQLYGHHPGVYMAGSTVTPGAILHPVDAVSYLTLGVTINKANSTALDDCLNGQAFVMAGTTGCLKASSTFGNTHKAFIRAM
jgi:hypothetical protein